MSRSALCPRAPPGVLSVFGMKPPRGENYFKKTLVALPMSKLILFGGKGGVGKTTTSAATAIWAADRGFKTLIVSSDPAHSTSDSFEQEIGREPTPIKGVEGLYAMEINPEIELKEFMPDFSTGLERPLKLMGIDDLEVSPDDLLFPGLDEALAFDKLLSYVESPEFDLIIFDTAPTGHTLRFLSLPELLDSWLMKMLKFRVQISRLKNLITGKKDTTLKDMQKLKKRVEHIRRVLTEEGITMFNLVLIPEQMAVMETRRALKKLQEYRIPVRGMIVNNIFPEDTDCKFCRARRKVQNKYIEQVKVLGEENGIEVALLPIFEEEVKGIEMLKKVAGVLYDKEQLHLNLSRTLDIKKEGNKLNISIYLPSAIAGDIDLRADGNILILDINGMLNQISLPENIDDRPISARFEENVLHVNVDMG